LKRCVAVGLVRAACAELNIAVFEWTIAMDLVRSGNNTPAVPSLQVRINTARHAIDFEVARIEQSLDFTTYRPSTGPGQYGEYFAGSGLYF